MKFLFFLLLANEVYASPVIEFIGPCDSRPILSVNNKYEFNTVGELTIGTLERYKLDYVGSSQGLNQVLGSPVGLDAMEVISDEEMRSYGWCFKVNGVMPQLYASEIPLTSDVKLVTWYYAYAYYKKGKWLSMCEEAYKLKPKFICK